MGLHLSFTPLSQYDELAPEKRLAAAVILDAIKARDFLFFNSPVFTFWCKVAGLDPQRLLTRLKERP
jgi:hypothetical protein